MAYTKISQAEARRNSKELAAMKDAEKKRLERWSREYPGGVNIATVPIEEIPEAKAETALQLGFVLVAKLDGNNLRIHALKP